MALFSLANKENKSESWLDEIKTLDSLFKSDSNLMQVCRSPQIAFKTKCNLLENSLGKYFDQSLSNFMIYVLKRGRFKQMPEILAEFKRLVDKQLGRLTVHLTTAKPLEEEFENSLKSALEKKLSKKINLSKKIDPNLIAGGVLTIGSKRIDSSLQGKLSRLKNHLLKGTLS